LQARGRFRRGNWRADLVGKVLLQARHAVPHGSLLPAGLVARPRRNVLPAPGRIDGGVGHRIRGLGGRLHGDLHVARGNVSRRARECLNVLLAACRPAALLDAERVDRDAAGFWWQQQAHHQGAILLAALHDVTRLDENRLVAAVLDLELVDVAGLAHLNCAFGQCLFKCQRRFARR
jgi:hypothetical protein